jgi:uncharacterized protein
MDVTPIVPSDRQMIESYGGGRFRINEVDYEGAVLVFPERSMPWPVASFAELSEESFALVAQAEPRVELLLLGCGPKMALLPSRLRQAVRAQGIVIEVMETGAACRTYNVLLAEGRRIAAALLPID